MTVRRVAVLSLALLAVGAGALVALGSRQGGVVRGGPLDSGRESRSSASLPIPVGGAASFGLLFVENRGNEEATLERVELEEASPGLAIVGAYAEQPARAAVGFLIGFPPRGVALRHPLAGAAVAPGETLRVVVGLRARTAGWHTGRGFLVHYRADGTSYVASYGLGVRLCAPRERWFGRCPAP